MYKYIHTHFVPQSRYDMCKCQPNICNNLLYSQRRVHWGEKRR